MSIMKVLENWSDYDDRKKKKGDGTDFSCTETWEVDYLINKIISVWKHLSRDQIKLAIQHCCKHLPAPHPREKFVKCVLQKLDVM